MADFVPKSAIVVISVLLQVLCPVSSTAPQQSLSLSVIHFPVSDAGVSNVFRLLINMVTVDTTHAKSMDESVTSPFHTLQITANTEQENP